MRASSRSSSKILMLRQLKLFAVGAASFGLGISATKIQSQPPITSNLNFVADAAEKVIDSVVNIAVETETSKFFQKTTLVSSGSGFFIEPGFILTNAHVVSDMVDSSKLIITTSDGQELDGYVHSLDTIADLAVIRIKSRNSLVWPVVKVGDNETTRLGDWVISIGSPFGLQNTVTAGVVSSLARKSTQIGGQDSRLRYIQTDCVVHSGSSGGPLVNLKGEVIGINTTRAESEGISFAIRIDTTLDMIGQLIKEGRVMRPFLGIHMSTLTEAVRQQLQESGDIKAVPPVKAGVLITNVLPLLILGFKVFTSEESRLEIAGCSHTCELLPCNIFTTAALTSRIASRRTCVDDCEEKCSLRN